MRQRIKRKDLDIYLQQLNALSTNIFQKHSNDNRIEWDISAQYVNVLGVGTTSVSNIIYRLTAFQLDIFDKVLKIMSLSRSNNTIFALFGAMDKYCAHSETDVFSVTDVGLLLDSCSQRRVTVTTFVNVKTIFLAWHELDYKDIPDETINFLFGVQNPIADPRNRRIMSDDPTLGWYTENEHDVLLSQVWSEFESGLNSLWNTTAILLSAQYGRRPIQLALLKIADLKFSDSSHGVTGKRIEFPGAKDQSSTEFRGSKIEVHPLSIELWDLCQQLASESVAAFKAAFNHPIPETEVGSLPLFYPKTKIAEKIKTSIKFVLPDQSVYNSEFLHTKSHALTDIISRERSPSPISERTGKRLKQNAYRFRYTRARQLARAGIPRSVLRFWLGHTCDSALDAYYDDPAERARVLNNDISPFLAPLSQAFHGAIVENELQAERGNDPSSRVQLDGKSTLGMGTCGEYGFCNASVPVPCYRCNKFQPWVYGPHGEVLLRLEARKDLENSLPRSGTGRRLLAPVQLDADIKAVRAVIEACKARMEESTHAKY